VKPKTEIEMLERLIEVVRNLPGLDVMARKRMLLGLIATQVRESQELTPDAVYEKLGLPSNSVSRLETGSSVQIREYLDYIFHFYDLLPSPTRYLMRLLIFECFPNGEDRVRLQKLRRQLPAQLIPRFSEPRIAMRAAAGAGSAVGKVHLPRRTFSQRY